MKPEIVLKHKFVEFIPDELEQGTIYVSIRFATASHLCLCGCGDKVVTPIRPTGWTLIFDGKTISLNPSIGNWSFPCQSHYWIRNNRIKWAPKWSKEQIERGRARHVYEEESYFSSRHAHNTAEADATTDQPETSRASFWRMMRFW
jgi:Family of unknown function (DUF6527)